MTVLIRPETDADFDAIDQVNRLAFGQDDEAALVRALRESAHARLSLVAEVGGAIVGHILLSRLSIVTEDGEVVEALSLAPMAVTPASQCKGIGTRLVEHALRTCRERGHRVIVVLGHPEFYRRFGFSPQLAEALAGPFRGEAWMAIELIPGALAGVKGRVDCPAPFGV